MDSRYPQGQEEDDQLRQAAPQGQWETAPQRHLMVDQVSDTLDCLPDCMMPDGADPCAGYKRVINVAVTLESEKQVLAAENKRLREFAIWMTGCGYDFCQHEYFCEERDALLKDQETDK